MKESDVTYKDQANEIIDAARREIQALFDCLYDVENVTVFQIRDANSAISNFAELQEYALRVFEYCNCTNGENSDEHLAKLSRVQLSFMKDNLELIKTSHKQVREYTPGNSKERE